MRTADDAYELAQRLRTAQHLDEAIKIGEHGLTLHGNKSTLGHWLAPLEEAQGRTQQALAAWEAAFQDSPTLAGWQAIERLAGKSWQQRKAALLPTLAAPYHSHTHAEILLYELMLRSRGGSSRLDTWKSHYWISTPII